MSKLSDKYTVVWGGIPVPPKEELLTDTEDEFSFWHGDIIVGINRNTEIWWRNQATIEEKSDV